MRPFANFTRHARVASNLMASNTKVPSAVDFGQAVTVLGSSAICDNDLCFRPQFVHLDPCFKDEIVIRNKWESGTAEALAIVSAVERHRKRAARRFRVGAVRRRTVPFQMHVFPIVIVDLFTGRHAGDERLAHPRPCGTKPTRRQGNVFWSCRTKTLARWQRDARRCVGRRRPLVRCGPIRSRAKWCRRSSAFLCVDRMQVDCSTENVRCRVPFLVNLHAEFGAEVGDDGGGSADQQTLSLPSLPLCPSTCRSGRNPPFFDSTSYVTGPCKMTFAPVS